MYTFKIASWEGSVVSIACGVKQSQQPHDTQFQLDTVWIPLGIPVIEHLEMSVWERSILWKVNVYDKQQIQILLKSFWHYRVVVFKQNI
jgi:hypothetical protein